jgi:hypothetical protein
MTLQKKLSEKKTMREVLQHQEGNKRTESLEP